MILRAIPTVALLILSYSIVGCHHKVAVKTDTPQTPQVATAPQPRPETPRAVAPQQRAQAPEVKQAASYPTKEELGTIDALLNRIQDAYFDYDQHTLRSDAEAALRADAQTLATIIKRYPSFKLTVEGYCDERGSEEYNLALGDARAQRAKEYLSTLGLPSDQMKTLSYGKQKQVCSESSEDCYQKNRRAHLSRVDSGA